MIKVYFYPSCSFFCCWAILFHCGDNRFEETWWFLHTSICEFAQVLCSDLPWYNCTGWLGIKHQLTYLCSDAAACALFQTCWWTWSQWRPSPTAQTPWSASRWWSMSLLLTSTLLSHPPCLSHRAPSYSPSHLAMHHVCWQVFMPLSQGGRNHRHLITAWSTSVFIGFGVCTVLQILDCLGIWGTILQGWKTWRKGIFCQDVGEFGNFMIVITG